MVNTLHRLEHVTHGFDNLKVVISMGKTESSGRPQNCENEPLQESLDGDSTQTQQPLAKALNVSQEAISRRLQATGKINKLCKWVPHDLNERQMENHKVTCEMLLQRHERKSFLIFVSNCDG
ncbi:mariner Mos1 transposase [Trichonephila clavipes]|nr:mariner Mos1 transposase [Trichonephila clavipes]